MEELKELKSAHLCMLSSVCGSYLCAAELEFYVEGDIKESFSKSLLSFLRGCNLGVYCIAEEDGDGQFEAKFDPFSNACDLAKTLCLAKQHIQKFCTDKHLKANFEAKPYVDQPGSAMHIHINIFNNSGENLFAGGDNGQESSHMLAAIAGLLDKMPQDLPHFLPNDNSFARIKAHQNSPCKISWGGNNRTVALRIPASTGEPQKRRIEHRVPGADADPYKVLLCILQAIEYGITKGLSPKVPKIYGNAWEDQYALSGIV